MRCKSGSRSRTTCDAPSTKRHPSQLQTRQVGSHPSINPVHEATGSRSAEDDRGEHTGNFKNKKPTDLSISGPFCNPAASYFPTASQQQYHRPWRA